jgi:predicted dehydrogenase
MVRIGAVCETYEPRMVGAGAIARARGHRTRYYRLYRDLIADDDIDAVIIATPDFSHHAIVLEALKAGKHIYVEQPLSLTWEQGVELLKAERESTQVIQVGSQRRSNPIYKRLSGDVPTVRALRTSPSLRPEVLKRGGVKLPEPLNFFDWQAGAAVRVPLSVDRFLNWRYYPEYGGGAIGDLGCTLLDGIHMLTGSGFPLSVTATGIRSKAADLDTFEKAAIEVNYPTGLAVSLSIDATAADNRERTIVDHREVTLDHDSGIATRAHIANFLDAIASRQPSRAPVRVAFPATLVCQMANLSIRSGRTVRWEATGLRVSID